MPCPDAVGPPERQPWRCWRHPAGRAVVSAAPTGGARCGSSSTISPQPEITRPPTQSVDTATTTRLAHGHRARDTAGVIAVSPAPNVAVPNATTDVGAAPGPPLPGRRAAHSDHRRQGSGRGGGSGWTGSGRGTSRVADALQWRAILDASDEVVGCGPVKANRPLHRSRRWRVAQRGRASAQDAVAPVRPPVGTHHLAGDAAVTVGGHVGFQADRGGGMLTRWCSVGRCRDLPSGGPGGQPFHGASARTNTRTPGDEHRCRRHTGPGGVSR
jgi:hypothetical protein